MKALKASLPFKYIYLTKIRDQQNAKCMNGLVDAIHMKICMLNRKEIAEMVIKNFIKKYKVHTFSF